MSATSITPKNRDTIFERILSEFLKGGKDYILNKEFALGEGWNKELKHFQFLYLNLLCNFSCDVEYYFNEKLKESFKIDCKSKVSIEELCTETCSVSIEKCNNVTTIEAIVKDILCECNK